MRFSTFASAALAAAPALVAAQGGQLGFAIGTKKTDGSCKYTADYEADFDALASASGAKIVRGYSASDCNFAQQVMPAAKNKGFKVIHGVWHTAVAKDTAAIQSSLRGNEAALYGITVGSEALYRGDLNGQQLLNLINQVKGKFPHTPIGTADSWNKYADGTANPLISGGVNLFLVNAFGFWQGQEIGNATHQFFDDIMQAFNHIQSTTNGKPDLWVGETGWPGDGGTSYGAAQAGTKNANQYYHQGVCGILKWGVNAFYFEAFDEPWKPDSKGDNGQSSDEKHWGAMRANRTPKFSLHC